jgi:signal transduction histidine kinase
MVRRDAATIHNWASSAMAASRRLLEFSRRHRAGREGVSLNALAAEAADLLRHRCERESIVLMVELSEEDPIVTGWPGPLLQVLVSLIQNSREAIGRGTGEGSIHVSTQVLDGRARASVEDDGPGIPSGAVEEVFLPSYSTKEEVPAAGMGLTVARWVARMHGGDVLLSDAEGGTVFTLELPAAP